MAHGSRGLDLDAERVDIVAGDVARVRGPAVGFLERSEPADRETVPVRAAQASTFAVADEVGDRLLEIDREENIAPESVDMARAI